MFDKMLNGAKWAAITSGVKNAEVVAWVDMGKSHYMVAVAGEPEGLHFYHCEDTASDIQRPEPIYPFFGETVDLPDLHAFAMMYKDTLISSGRY